MEDEYLNYDVNINGNLYEFSLDTYDGESYLSILDAGGLADAVPKYWEQYEWIEPRLAKIPGIKQTWTTRWHIQTPSALKKVKALLKKHEFHEK